MTRPAIALGERDIQMTSKRTPRAGRAILVLTVLLMLAGQGVAAAVTTIGGLTDHEYTEQDPAFLAAPGITINGGNAYDGEFMDFSLDSQQAEEILALQSVETPDVTNGVVSVVGTSIYLGDGAAATVIASIDGVFNGTNGQKLRINFTSDFQNPGFETDGGSTNGWTLVEGVVDLGVTELAGFTSPDSADYPANSGGNDNDFPSRPGTFSVTSDSSTASAGTYSMRLSSSGMTTLNSCDVVHGPAAISGGFEASSGDEIFFDWRAFSGADAYHVFGYIIDEAGNETVVLDTYTNSTSNTDWVTKATTIPADGTYKFVFVSGTYDATCGNAAGAALHIDNVRVYGSKVNDAAVQQIARLLTYENGSDAPTPTRTVTIDAVSQVDGTATDTFEIAITPVHDAPSIDDPAAAVFNNLEGDDDFTPITGTITGDDPDEDVKAFDITDSETGSWELDGVTYDRRVVGTWSTLYVESATGNYRAEVDDALAEAMVVDDSEAYEVSMTVDGVTVATDFEIQMNVETAPGAPVLDTATSGINAVELDWTAPEWVGGSPITDYVVRYSTNGVDWTVFDDGVGTGTSTTVTGLTAGTEYQFDVMATNANGTGAASAPKSATPRTGQAPLVGVTGGFSIGKSATLGSTGGSGTGAVTYEVISGPCVINGTSITSTTAGVCRVVATKAGDSTYVAATSAAFRIIAADAPAAVLDDPEDPTNDDDEFRSGDPVEITACGFEAGSEVELTLDDGTDLGTALIGSDGCFTGTVTLPEDLEDGDHSFTVTGKDTYGAAASTTVPFTIRAGYAPGPCLSMTWSIESPTIFSDVEAGRFYTDPTSWAYRNEIVYGRSAGTMAPDSAMTRAELVTMVHRMLCLPEPEAVAPFGDIVEGSYYDTALDWAYGAGVIEGRNGDVFDPDAPVTRGELAAILHRLAELPTPDDGVSFADVDSDRFYAAATSWMGATGLADADDAFDPEGSTSRAEALTMLHRLNTEDLY
ncbi:MAG: S-layer homology domain-containing protein [Acidimicrobiales bacterium]